MDVQEILTHARDILTVKRVFGEPYEHDGMTKVPVARVTGGAGGGQGVQPDDKGGTGGGFGLVMAPVGVYVIKDGQVSWHPALDVNRIIAGGQIVVAILLLTIRSIVRSRAKARAVHADDKGAITWAR